MKLSKGIKRRYNRISVRLSRINIRMLIAVSFTVTTAVGMIILGLAMYTLFDRRTTELMNVNTEQILSQTATNLESYLRNMRLISDTMTYSVIKETDLATGSLNEKMNLLYEANKDNLISMSCYRRNGLPVASVPFAAYSDHVDVSEQKWFTNAMEEVENIHFSTPHVENLFDNTSQRYYWVVSLARAVELTERGRTATGVLLIDMNYSSIEQLFEKVNKDRAPGYVYLCDRNGEIIYHPRQNLIYASLYEENNLQEVSYSDGTTVEVFGGEKRYVTVRTVGYTGWKIVGVMPAGGRMYAGY